MSRGFAVLVSIVVFMHSAVAVLGWPMAWA